MDFELQFEWDLEKARSNLAKHKVSFELASTIFRDPLALTVYDEEHSEEEERWATMGRAENGKLLVVVHTYLATGVAHADIRIISAREPTRRERLDYEQAPR